MSLFDCFEMDCGNLEVRKNSACLFVGSGSIWNHSLLCFCPLLLLEFDKSKSLLLLTKSFLILCSFNIGQPKPLIMYSVQKSVYGEQVIVVDA